MKKKFIAVYALIGVLALGSTTLTSCVDDNESASVTAVRDAKAAQLNALAALNKAKAEAEKITAEAEAAYKAAETRWQEIQNEMDELKLQAMKDTLETSLKTAQLIAEQNLMAAQEAMEDAKAQLIAALDKVDQANKTRINTLINNADAILNGGTIDRVYYSPTYNQGGANSIVALRSQLLTEEANLIKYNYNLKDVDAAIAEYVNEQEANKALKEALKAEYEELKANSSREAIEKEYTEALAAQEAASTALVSAVETKNLKQKAVDDYTNNVLPYIEIEDAMWYNQDYRTSYVPYLTPTNEISDLLYYEELINPDDPSQGTTSYLRDMGVSLFLDWKTIDDYKVVDTYDNGVTLNYSNSYYWGEREYTAEKAQLLSDLLTFITRDIAVYTKEVVEVDRKALNDALAANQATLTSLNQAVATAKAAYDANPTKDNAEALQKAEDDVKNFEENYPQTGTTIAVLRDELERSEDALVDKQEAQAVITKIQTLLSGDAMTEYANHYAEVYKLQEEFFAADIEWRKSKFNKGIADDLVNRLDDYVANGGSSEIPDWDKYIAECDDAIKTADKNIELVNKEDQDLDGNGTVDEDEKKLAMQVLVDETEANIERIKIQIEQQEAQYDSYMQQAQELIENGSTIPDVEVPETPSEDEGTDTPAEETPAE